MKCCLLFAVLPFAVLLPASLTRAQLLSVDINKCQAPRTDDTSNPFAVVVTDNGTPNLSATQTFSVIVSPLTKPTVTAGFVASQLSFAVSGQTGPDYAVLTSSNLSDWNTLFTTNSPAMPFNWADPNPPALPVQFYRVKLGPPLP